jgi:thymidylate kinase
VAVIAFFGPDGVGKSTQASLLMDYLAARNVRTKRAWIRAGHTFAFALGTTLIKLGFVRETPERTGQNLRRLNLDRLPALRALWPWIELMSVLPLILIRVKIPSLLGRVVVCERYTVDSVPSISYITGDKAFDQHFVARVLISMIPRSYALVNLDCDYHTLISRRGGLAESEEFIEIQRKMYQRFRTKLGALYVDTATTDVSETQSLIRNYFESRITMRPSTTSSES